MKISKTARLRLARGIVGIIAIVGLLLLMLPSSPFFFMKVFPTPDSEQMIFIQRYSNHSEGISIAQNLEMRDVFDEVKQINSLNNEFLNSTLTSNYGFCTLNHSTIDHYNQSLDKDESIVNPRCL